MGGHDRLTDLMCKMRERKVALRTTSFLTKVDSSPCTDKGKTENELGSGTTGKLLSISEQHFLFIK